MELSKSIYSSPASGQGQTDDAQRKSGKALIVFSDGTGNSSAKLQKTNVWRLYQAVDTSDTDDPADRQLVLYDNGVGTSSFKPLALLGGAFGVGLRRNVLDLYRFLCRHYEPGDRIYAFGFSRGAFTVRVLIGFICEVGLLDVRGRNGKGLTEAELDRLSSEAYRRFRRCFKIKGVTAPLVHGLRNLRDMFTRRPRNGEATLDANLFQIDNQTIRFVGVWDTVAAYGAPIAEITHGIDRWLWPLSMPNYHLSEKVMRARHALALDDERDTFHPLLWDEVHEQQLVANEQKSGIGPNRLRQVWFSGMHSDVGGGYSDDSLAHVSLLWMVDEARPTGLRLCTERVEEFRQIANSLGPMHDSRSGVASYYRYQPRRISARLDPPDPLTRIVQDPDLEHGLLKEVRIHSSVLERIRAGIAGYAPIVLPAHYRVEGGPPVEHQPEIRAKAQEAVWDQVWKRRVTYFTTLILTLLLLSMPLLPREPVLACSGPQCVLASVFDALRWLLPDFIGPWIDAFEAHPGILMLLGTGIVGMMKWTSSVEVGLRDQMRQLFRASLAAPAQGTQPLREVDVPTTAIRKVRANYSYQGLVRLLKWHLGPFTAAMAIAASSCVLIVAGFVLVVGSAHRVHMAVAEEFESYCDGDTVAAGTVFATNQLCWRSGTIVEKNKRYRVEMQLLDDWSDGHIKASPEGFWSERFQWWFRYPAVFLRRSMSDPWFQPLVRVAGHRSLWGTTVSLRMKPVSTDTRLYVGEFTAPANGPLILSVNDAVWLWGKNDQFFYRQADDGNFGTAQVTIEPVN